MDIQTRKVEFIKEFLKIQNEDLISLLEDLLKAGKLHKNKGFQPMSIEVLKKRIDKSLEDSANGRLTESGALKAEVEKWE